MDIVGGIYRERCMRPHWDEVYGSAGRAASAIKRLGGGAILHGYVDADARAIIELRRANDGIEFVAYDRADRLGFSYTHGLSCPRFNRPASQLPQLTVAKDKVLRFGMLEGTARVDADYAVFDPQNVHAPESFHANGSRANHLALILNRYEAITLLRQHDLSPEAMAERLAHSERAEVVVLKLGPEGALVWHSGRLQRVPAYQTQSVWKIGSGDQFVANFAYAWMEQGCEPVLAAERASRATAYYCQYRDFPTAEELEEFRPMPIEVSDNFREGRRPVVYLAGPFFTLAQLWVVEQARRYLQEMQIDVFSPYHEVGPGPAEIVVPEDIEGIRQCDLMLAIVDGSDTGTVFEVGYARHAGKPVIVYAENESAENLKMMMGSDCFMRDDFVSAIYQTVWTAVAL